MKGAAGALPDWGAVGEDGGGGARVTAGAGVGSVSAEVWGGTGVQAGAGAGEGGSARALDPGREAGLQVSEASAEPPNAGTSGSRPEPGLGRWSVLDEGKGFGLGAAAWARGGLGWAEAA